MKISPCDVDSIPFEHWVDGFCSSVTVYEHSARKGILRLLRGHVKGLEVLGCQGFAGFRGCLSGFEGFQSFRGCGD